MSQEKMSDEELGRIANGVIDVFRQLFLSEEKAKPETDNMDATDNTGYPIHGTVFFMSLRRKGCTDDEFGLAVMYNNNSIDWVSCNTDAEALESHVNLNNVDSFRWRYVHQIFPPLSETKN